MELTPQENNSLAFRVNVVPVAQPRQRSVAYKDKSGNARVGTPYTSKKHPVNTFKAAVSDTAGVFMEGRAMIKSPVHLGLTVVLPRPKALTREWKSTGRVPMIKVKGDNDNFEKCVYDAMEGVVYPNDCLIYSNFTETFYAAEDETPHVIVLVQPRDYIPSAEETPPDGRKRKRQADPERNKTANT